MIEVSSSLVFSFFLFLLIPFVFGAFFKKMGFSAIIGYIISGLILGFLSPNLKDNFTVQNFAYFGIVLLLFTIGLEVNFKQILTFKKIIVFGGILQLSLSVIFTTLIALFFNFSLLQSFLVGVILSSSSTTLVAKILEEKGEETSFVGEIVMGILMFQNIAFIPYMIILNSIYSNQLDFFPMFFNIVGGLVKSTLIIAIMWYIGDKITPRLFDKIAKISRELLNLFIFVFIFFITYVCLLVNIPTLIGVFIAGILVSQSLEHYHIFSQISPLRNILGVIFFVFIGLNVNLFLIFNNLYSVIFFTTLVILIKALIILFIFLFLRFHSRLAFGLALYLFQIDEDAFILSSIAFTHRLISYDQYLFLITSVLLSLILTPVIVDNKTLIYNLIRRFIKKYLPFLENYINYRVDRDRSPIDVLSIKKHIVICGYGRVGNLIGRALLLTNIPFVAVDYNFYTVYQARKEGVNIIYGDPTDINILDYVEVDDALMLITVIPDLKDQEAIIINTKRLNPKIFIIARVHKEEEKKRLRELGADMVIQPESEASFSIIKKIYAFMNLPKEKIIEKIKLLRIEAS